MMFESDKCPSCDADIHIPSGTETVKCLFCGSTLCVKDVIREDRNNIGGQGTFNANIDMTVMSGHGFIRQGKWPEAEKAFKNAIALNPSDYRGWWGLFLVKTNNMKKVSGYLHLTDTSDATTAVKLAPPELKNQLKEVLNKYNTRTPPI